MSAPESKRKMQPLPPIVRLALSLDDTAKKAKLMREEFMISNEKWARRFSVRLLVASSEYLDYRDLCNILLVCSGWTIPSFLRDRLYEQYYRRHYELSTA